MILSLAAAMLLAQTIDLPAGETHLSRPMDIPRASNHLVIRGNPKGSTLVLDPNFTGPAALVADSPKDITFENFAIRGDRRELKTDWYLPPGETLFADFFSANGILVRNGAGVTIRSVSFSAIRAFPILVNASSDLLIDTVRIEDSGTLNRAGRNNTSGGILLEEGVSRFEIRNCAISRIAGNAIWTHSYSNSPRSADGTIHHNTITRVARDAIQIGHATRVRVENNTGSELGYPTEQVDIESQAVAVALDSAGDVDNSLYAQNRFTDVNGQCIDLDGFHDGEVLSNSCINRKPLSFYPALHAGIIFGNSYPKFDPGRVLVSGNTIEGFAYGAVFLIGRENRIENNRFLNMNRAHCGTTPVPARCNYLLEQPDLLRAGIFLADTGARPVETKDNIIRGNTITGFGMKEHCIAAAKGKTLASNRIEGNICQDQVR